MNTLKNLIHTHLSSEEVEAVENALNQLENAVSDKLTHLSAEERRKYGSISEQNKLFVNKVYDYAEMQSKLRSPDVDWDEFGKDFASRAFLERVIARLENILNGINNSKILHDHDNYQASLDDYNYTCYKQNTAAVGYETKFNDLRQFFLRNKPIKETPEPDTETPKTEE